MNKTAELYRALFDELNNHNYGIDNNVYRKYIYGCGEGIVYSVSVREKLRGLSIPIQTAKKSLKFPAWKGVEIALVTHPEYSGDDQLYIQLRQMPGIEPMIYEIVAENIRKELESAAQLSEFASVTYTVLKKWKEFFSSGKKPILSSTSAQGLYGELLFLKDLIREIGVSAVNSWAGVNNETHDFYIGQNAVEIKTTAVQAPYMAHISSEYQMDDQDVNGVLFLRMYAFRKDANGGQRLPEIIKEIRASLSSDIGMLAVFNGKLNKAGYFDAAEDYYMEGYTLREEYSFKVKEGFPRIIRDDLMSGVYDAEYNVSVSQCMDFAIEAKDLFEALKR